MKIQIEKDAATKISKEVATLDDARVFANNGFHVSIDVDGVLVPLSEYVEPSPEDAVAAQRAEAEAKAFDKSGLTEAKWKKLPKADREALITAELPVIPS